MFAVTLMIISAVVGAGFATGAELIAFFGSSTLPPIVVATLVGVFLFCVMVALVFQTPRPSGTPLVIEGNILWRPVFFVFFVAMTAGVTELAGPVASAIAVVISVLIVLFGFEKMLTANKFLMSFALCVLLIVVVSNFGKATATLTGEWKTLGSALLYAGMNCCLLPGIFARVRITRKELLVSIFVAAVIISFFVLLILTAIRNVSDATMPILALSNSFVVKLAVFICILTSMFAALFNLQTKYPAPEPALSAVEVGHPFTLKGSFYLVVVAGVAYGCSFLGFTKVIGIFYPIVGGVMIGVISFSLMRSLIRVLRGSFVCRRIRVR